MSDGRDYSLYEDWILYHAYRDGGIREAVRLLPDRTPGSLICRVAAIGARHIPKEKAARTKPAAEAKRPGDSDYGRLPEGLGEAD